MSTREPLSVFVTTLNNAATLETCLKSVAWADEILVLDSGSTDATAAIAARYGARFLVEPFKGYGPQKASAMAQTTHAWCLLLDADEALTDESRAAIEAALVDPKVAGFTLPRREQLFWRWQAQHARHNPMLRLFDKRRARFSLDAIHAAPEVDGPVGALPTPFLHYGEPDIATKVAKVNHYSSGMVAGKIAKREPFVRTRMILQPPWHFFRSYVLKRKFLAGWAGFIGCAVDAFYVFLKYAKVNEAKQKKDSP
jgi:glycosyltransferase involved in cell wall biosynthesis